MNNALRKQSCWHCKKQFYDISHPYSERWKKYFCSKQCWLESKEYKFLLARVNKIVDCMTKDYQDKLLGLITHPDARDILISVLEKRIENYKPILRTGLIQ